MEEIRVSKISQENYDDIRWYLDTIIPYVNCLSDLCFVDYNGVRHMVTRNEGSFVVVANENRELNPYVVTLDESDHVQQYSTERADYDISLDFGSGIYGVKKDDRLTGMSEQLVYFPNDEELDATSIDYYQVCQQNKNACIMSYEFPSRMEDINYGLNYTLYHNPDKIVLMEMKKILGMIDHVGSSVFFKTPNREEYRKNLLRIRNILIPKPFVGYDPDLLIECIAKAGYQREIPDDLKTLIRGDFPLVKRLENVSKSYDNFTKGQ